MKKNNNLAIIGASYLQLPLIEKAKELGYVTHVFAWKNNDVGENEADFFYPISIVNKEIIAQKCKEIGICGICSIASDLASITVNYVANELGLIGNDMTATMVCTNKHLMRLAFEQNGDPSPRSFLVDKETDLSKFDFPFPIIVKPTDRSGSRGICKLINNSGINEAVKNACNESLEGKALIEEFVEGQEYSVEGISYQGEHHILAITQKYTTGAPQFIETGHLEPAPLNKDVYEKIVSIVMHALNTLNIKNSASHSEIKIDPNGNIKIIEIGARMGGGLIGSDLVRITTGIDFVRAVIDVACGKKPILKKTCIPCSALIKFIITSKDHEEFLRLLHDNPQKIIKIGFYHPEWIGKLRDESNRPGCFIVKVNK